MSVRVASKHAASGPSASGGRGTQTGPVLAGSIRPMAHHTMDLAVHRVAPHPSPMPPGGLEQRPAGTPKALSTQGSTDGQVTCPCGTSLACTLRAVRGAARAWAGVFVEQRRLPIQPSPKTTNLSGIQS